MFKIRQGLPLQQCPKHRGLVSRLLEWSQVLNLTKGHQPFDPILWAPNLKITKCRTYLDSGLPASIKNSNWMCSFLSTTASSTFSIFLNLEHSGMQYADFQEEENKAERYCWEDIAANLKDLTLKLFREAK